MKFQGKHLDGNVKQAAGTVCLGLGRENRVGSGQCGGEWDFQGGKQYSCTYELFIGFDGYLKGTFYRIKSLLLASASLSDTLGSTWRVWERGREYMDTFYWWNQIYIKFQI